MCITVSYMFYHVYHHPAINIEDLFCVSPSCHQHLIPLVGVPGLAKDYQLLDLGCAANYNFKCSAHRRRAPCSSIPCRLMSLSARARAHARGSPAPHRRKHGGPHAQGRQRRIAASTGGTARTGLPYRHGGRTHRAPATGPLVQDAERD